MFDQTGLGEGGPHDGRGVPFAQDELIVAQIVRVLEIETHLIKVEDGHQFRDR